MIEALPSPELEKQAQAITSAINDWLLHEYAISNTNRNSYIDNLTGLRNSLTLPLDDPMNFSAQKYLSHSNRHRFWSESFLADPLHDWLSARQLFNAQMQMCGVYKRICALQAINQEDYYRRKENSLQPAGIDLYRHVVSRVLFRQVPSNAQELSPGRIVTATTNAFELTKEGIQFLEAHARDDFGLEDSESVRSLQVVQATWAEIVTDHILLAAQLRSGNLTAVPFLEAKSISDEPAIYYPFAN